MCFSRSRCTKTRFRPGLCPGPLKYPYYGYFSSPKEAEARQTCRGFFLKFLLESPGNLLEICLIKFVDTLNYMHHTNDCIIIIKNYYYYYGNQQDIGVSEGNEK